jgi:hypothetical protein
VNRLLANPRLLGLICAAGAVAQGIGYLIAAGAPSRYPIINAAAFAVGAMAWLALRGRNAPRWSGWVVLALAALLLATAVAGAELNGASRWVMVGPLSLQTSFVVLPALIVLYARTMDAIGTAGVLVAAAALAAQPDRAMAAMLAVGAAVIAFDKPGRMTAIATVACAVAFVVTLFRPDSLPAEPFVERVLYTAFESYVLAGIAVLLGSLLIVAPAMLAHRRVPEQTVLLAFGVSWTAVIAAAAIGNYLTPLVGYDGAAVIGYLLSVALLPANAREA